MIVLAGIVARNFAIANITRPSSLKTLFQFHQSTPNDQLTEKVQQRKHEAENIVQQLERNWEKEAGSKRFIDKHSDLRAQKEAYENLAQLREQKLKQLEYATRNLSPQARISVEKEIDGIRLRLEHELGSGPFYLRRLKQEIEISRQRLEPTLLNARRELAQVEKDWDASFKRNSSVPAIIVLIISFFYGSIVELYHNSPRAPLRVEPVSQEAPPQPHIAPQPPLARPPNNNDFGPYYNLCLAYAAQGNSEGAKVCMQRALAFRKNESWDESYTEAHYYLGLSKARLGEADEEIKSLEKSLKANPELIYQRFELANLYLSVGKNRDAINQYKIMKSNNNVLAEELRKLMKKHGIRI